MIKAEVVRLAGRPPRDNPRFVVTNLRQTPRCVYGRAIRRVPRGRGRGYPEAANLLGTDFAGVIVRDGWAPYRRFTAATHQSCLAHLLRRAKTLRTDHPYTSWRRIPVGLTIIRLRSWGGNHGQGAGAGPAVAPAARG